MAQLEGKVAMVTGAARGMGRAHAETLARAGADLVLTDIAAPIGSVEYPLGSSDDLRETAARVEALGRRVITAEADVRDQAATDAAVARGIDELGQIDILIANAGIWTVGNVWELTDEQWNDTIDTNLTGVWRSTKAVLPHMMERRQGAIVMISSSNGLEAAPNFAHYVAAKHGVIGLMKSVAYECGPSNIRCNVICPGTIDTPISEWQGAYDMMAGGPGGTHAHRYEGARHWAALAGRTLLPPETVANAALWLVSDAAENVTGVVLPIDSGHNILPGLNPEPVR